MNKSTQKFILDNGMFMSWAIALIATLGSLYFSEILYYEPCKLCWFQRILMYPLVIMIAIAAVRKDIKQYVYILPVAIVGICFSTYHVLLQKTDWLKNVSAKCGIVPCDTDYINWFGFITIPVLAWIAFALIIILQICVMKAARGNR
ncbi:disulfide oxidoreductase [Paenibacillus sp. N1-5-1-14]|uniref:disulfide oxidoreductase n=1 Tax=Paenibacillus radicibacter TaxID=2972488 RepID=UPI002158C7C2|nr:disulfide oxidoreductase [Paenibacillus radicibacter]MCR8643837.1 disulfide oxidoreductase [Paenibacillus radicibacter]